MSIALIKKLNEKTPYWLKRPFAKVIRKRLVENNIFKETYALLKMGDGMSSEEKHKWQVE